MDLRKEAERWLSGQASAHVQWTKKEPDDADSLLALLERVARGAREEGQKNPPLGAAMEQVETLVAEARGQGRKEGREAERQKMQDVGEAAILRALEDTE